MDIDAALPTISSPPRAPRSHVRDTALSRALAAVRWDLVAPAALAGIAAILYLVNLTASGCANAYYAAAAQAGSQSWSASFFGSLDAGGFITVDKPPLALWVMGLSVRLLGLSPLAILLPQALAGVAAVVLLYDAVRRQFGRAAGVIAGLAFALTPVAALMFRYDNPDAVLVLLLVAAAWSLVRSLDDDRLRWVVLAGSLVGLAFLTKFLQAYLVLPAFALTYLVAAPGAFGRRVGRLVIAAVSVAIASLWWVAIVELVPATSRPFIGGSQSNSVVELLLGYDGLGRILGAGPAGGGANGVGGGGPGAGFGGPPGLLRLLNDAWAGQIGWLLPTALAGLGVGLVVRFRTPRTDARRAGYLLWGGWLLVHVAVFSLMRGIVHPYYAVAIAPAAAALVGAGVTELWRLRARIPWAGLVLGGLLIGTAVWAWMLLDRTPAFVPGAGIAALCLAIAAAIVLAVPVAAGDIRADGIARGAVVVGLAAILVGPALFTIQTASQPIDGGDPAAGPVTGPAAAFGGPGGFGGPAGGGGITAIPGDGDLTLAGDALVDYLLANQGEATWLVAVTSANQAAPIQLASGVPVMAMGGFMGSDPAPTLDQLRGDVAAGRLRYVLLGGAFGGGGGFGAPGGFGSAARTRDAWVTTACSRVLVPGVNATLYDCAGAA